MKIPDQLIRCEHQSSLHIILFLLASFKKSIKATFIILYTVLVAIRNEPEWREFEVNYSRPR